MKKVTEKACIAATIIMARWAEESIVTANPTDVILVGKEPERDYNTSKFENHESQLYPNYCQWCWDNHIINQVIPLRQFKPTLAEHFWNSKVGARSCLVKGVAAYSGIKLAKAND